LIILQNTQVVHSITSYRQLVEEEATIEDVTARVEEYTAACARLSIVIETWSLRWQRTKRLWTKQLPCVKDGWQSSAKRKLTFWSPFQLPKYRSLLPEHQGEIFGIFTHMLEVLGAKRLQ